MAILVIADHDGHILRDTTLRTLRAAQLISAQVDVLVYGEDISGVAGVAARAEGVRHVLLSEGPQLKAEFAEAVAELIAGLAGEYEGFAIPASASGRNFAPRLAARLNVALISEVIDVIGPSTFVRPIYAGNALETVQSQDTIKVLTVRPTAFAAVAASGGSAGVTRVAAPALNGRIRLISEERVVSDRPELGAAKIVVSGGRALGSAEEFKAVLEPLADRLGAAVGASRAAVDAGYAPNDYQVGQTGKIVAPSLYFAVGISGAIQHLAGMKDSKIIIAINKDPEAPIFSVADIGLVEDYRTAIPALMTALK